MSQVSIIGTSHTPFGAFVKKNKETGEITDLKSIYDLMLEAGRAALEDAGIPAQDVDGIWVGSCAPGLFANQEHLAAFAPEIDPEGLRFKPMNRCESACASGSVALYNALYAIEAGRCRIALVIGVEKMNLLPTRGVTHALATCSYWPEEGGAGTSFPCLFAQYAQGYSDHHHIPAEALKIQLAHVAALNYKNGLENPLAHFGAGSPADKLGLSEPEAILQLPEDKNPVIAAPLRLHDCSLVSDGAAALVLMKRDEAKKCAKKAVEIAGIGHVNERMPLSVRPNLHEFLAGREAVRQALQEARIAMSEVRLAEVHDCFTITQLLITEALGLAKPGQAGIDYQQGRFTRDDRCAINLSGGLKAKGHPVGATGVSMHVLVAKQLMGEPLGVALPGKPDIGLTFNVGGSAVTHCVSVLRRVQ